MKEKLIMILLSVILKCTSLENVSCYILDSGKTYAIAMEFSFQIVTIEHQFAWIFHMNLTDCFTNFTFNFN